MSFHGMRPTRQYPVLDKELATLEVRQQPQQALVTSEHKEKTRKAIDPPPIVQLKVDEKRSHDQGNWLVNPFMFMIAVLVEAEPTQQTDLNDPSTDAWKPVQGNNLLGQTVSSLHRLKDVNNVDGGYFVFGDISCKRIGFYRLQFNLFDFQKNSGEAVFVKSVVSEPFQVVSSKEFRGQRESTPLSRTFSDQGVRLRLRKEQRVLQGTKRAYGGSPVASSARAGPYGVYNGVQSDRAYAHPAPKRQKSGYDYNSQVYYPQQVPSNPVYQYNNVLQGNTYGVPSQTQSGHQLEQSTPYPGLMAGQGYLQSNSASSWQRPMQQGHVAASYNGAGSSPYLGSMHHAPPTTRDSAASVHAQHHGQQVGLRAGDETFNAALGGMHTPSSIADTTPTSTSQQQQSFLTARGDVQEHENDDGIGGHPSYAVQHHHVGDAHGQMGYRMGVANQPVPSYTSSMQPATSAAYDPQLQESAVARYHDRQFNNAHNLYSDPSRASLSSHGVPMADDHESLDSGILNRGFVPSYRQQPVGMEHGAAHYKEGYPTPHQTSPL